MTQAVVMEHENRIPCAAMTLYVGTSGWAYPEWQPEFYPAGLPRARFLEHYAGRLSACEVNATFYRLQAETTFERWAGAAPPDFRFIAKAHRRLTHSATLMAEEADREFLHRFLESLRPLAGAFGALLVQFPPTRRRDDAGLARLLAALPASVPAACEFRHASWDDDGVRSILHDAGAAWCYADTDGVAPASLPSGAFAYVRLRATHYTDAQRDQWRQLLVREAVDRPVYAFAKHEGVPAGDPHAGVGFACWLADATS
jgi:uncharacterized protein YecE (DUF72 family)